MWAWLVHHAPDDGLRGYGVERGGEQHGMGERETLDRTAALR